MKPSSTYFHRAAKGDDLSAYKRTHQRVFPGNELAVLQGENGTLLVKVARPHFTAKPAGALSIEEAKQEAERVAGPQVMGGI